MEYIIADSLNIKRGYIMNKKLQNLARQELKDGLGKLPAKHQHFFKRLYSHEDLGASIDDVVDKMPANKLDWAMQQVERSLSKINSLNIK